MARYYVEMDGYQYGPFDLEELRQLNASGVLASTSHVREEHASDGEVLVQLLANAPSPQPEGGPTAPVDETPPDRPEPVPSVQVQSPPVENPVETSQAEADFPAPGGRGPSQNGAEAPAAHAPNALAGETPAVTVSWSERLAQLRSTTSAPGATIQTASLNRPGADVVVRQPAYAPEPARVQAPGTTAPEETVSLPAPELGRFVPEQPQPVHEPAASAWTGASAASVAPSGPDQPASVTFEPATSATPAVVWQETGPAPQVATEGSHNDEWGAAPVRQEPAVSMQASPAENAAGTPAGPSAAGSWPPPAVFADLKLAPVGNDDPAEEESSSFSLPPLKYGIEETDLKTPSEWLEPPPPRPRPSMAFGDPDQDTEVPAVVSPAPQATVPSAPAVQSVQPAIASPVGIAGGTAAIPEGVQPAPVPLSQEPRTPQTVSVPPAAPIGAVPVQSRQAQEEELTLSKEKLSRLDDIYGRSRPAPVTAQPETGAMRSSMQQQPVEPQPKTAQEDGEKPAEKKTNLIAGLVLIGAGAVSLMAGAEYVNVTTCPGLVMALVLIAYGGLVLVGGLLAWLGVRWVAPVVRILMLIPLGVLLASVYYHQKDLMAFKIPVFLQKPLMYNAISLLATALGPAIWPGRSKTTRTT